MLPLTVAHQLRATLLDYLRTTFGFTNADLEDALFAYLQDPEHGLFKGPYIDLCLPFRTATPAEHEAIPLDVGPPFVPYAHQLRSFERLTSRGDHQPQSTLVTTGTGSGKTECFLYPVLDHCRRHQAAPGIKAILLYPMNALASDQAERIAKELHRRPELKHVTAGLYVGGDGSHGTPDERHLIDKRKLLRQSPPDILLTNYRMLDYLLMRPADVPLWRKNRPETLQYLVLDELHTYDGAQGSDVACLIRRLKARLGTAPGHLTCVGTSATIGGASASDSRGRLVEFAEQVFGEELGLESLIGEDRYDADEVFPPLLAEDDDTGEGALTGDPLDSDDGLTLDPRAFADPAEYLKDQARAWLGLETGKDEALDAVEVGARLTRHVFLRRLLEAIRGRDERGGPRVWTELAAHLAGADPRYAELQPEEQWRVLSSFLSLVAYARLKEGESENPFLTLQVQLWVRELRGLVRRLEAKGHTFAWRDELDAHPGEHFVPVVFCRECGADGVGALKVEGRDRLVGDSRRVGLAYLQRAETARYLRLNELRAREDGQLALQETICPACLAVKMGGDRHDCQPGGVPMIPVALYEQLNDKHRFTATCPTCGADDALRMLGSRAASLSSVAISHLFHSPFHGDVDDTSDEPDGRKLLAFTDSVQDASHRAGFFAGRTYRFNLRTAMYSTVAEAGGSLPLEEVADRMMADWSARLGEARMIVTFMPPDLREHEHYVAYVRSVERREKVRKKVRAGLDRVLRARLRWEVTREFGHAVTIGRSLDGTACATLAVDEAKLAEATTQLTAQLREGRPIARPGGAIEEGDVRHFLEGLIQRLRVRGGIFHEFLESYVKNGNPYFLFKRKNPLFSPHHRNAVPPRFLFDGEKHKVFDSLRTPVARQTWLRDWTARSLKCSEKDAGIGVVLAEALERLVRAGIVREHPCGKSRAFGLDPTAFAVTTDVGRVHCIKCRSAATLEVGAAARWEHRTCTHYRCKMSYYEAASPPAQHDYYRSLYRSGRVHRIFTGEHTGLLEREVREKLEIDFKTGARPDAPNLLTCTPTLEMGIDIGDLESVMLCSVPPLPSSYLQRIGRAGRSTGNALVVAVPNARPHDLYFHREPEAMLRGEVRPPGCFLDAAAMLERQMAAHAMDRWASDPDVVSNVPREMRMLLGPANKEGFPKTFVTFYEARHAALTAEFLAVFGDNLSEGTREQLEAFGAERKVPRRMQEAFDKVRRDREDLRKQIADLKERKKELEADPSTAQPDPERSHASVAEAAEDELGDIEDSIRAYRRVLNALGFKRPLQVLCDESVLPNYAFPEPGVTLKSVLRRPREKGDDKKKPGDTKVKPKGSRSASLRFEYMRPAHAALREFAPFNTFYAEGHKVRVSQIDLGSKQHPLVHTWRFCPKCACSVRLPDERAEAPTCPRCEDPGWADAGQRRDVVHFQQAWSSMNLAEATTADETEEREEQSYRLMTLVEVPEDLALRGPSWLVEDQALLFGYELLRQVEIRQLNLGRRGDTGHEMHLAGALVSQQGFTVCRVCGKVQEPRSDKAMQHTPYCRSRIGNVPEQAASVYLARGIRSEALRVLLPVSSFDLVGFVPTFEAALSLGLRKHFGGQPQHLRIESTSEPSNGEELQFVVIYDAVPGGTGYLADLAKRENFRAVIEKSYAAMRDCACAGGERHDGCYRCVYAYQSSRKIPSISRRRALEVFGRILERWHELEHCTTLSDVDASTSVESELEMKFLAALKHYVVDKGGEWGTVFYGGKECFQLVLGENRWRVEPQVEMRVGPIVTRPDFMLRLLGRPELLPMAVYCDGHRYHVQPERQFSRLGGDIEKRRALLADEQCWVWSLTWKDVEDLELSRVKPTIDPLFPAARTPLEKGAKLEFSNAELERAGLGAVEQLLAFLRDPDVESWTRTAAHAAVALLDVAKSPEASDLAGVWKAQQWQVHAAEPEWLSSKKAKVLAGHHSRPGIRVLAQLGLAELKAKNVGRAKVLLRLQDHAPERKQPTFEADWRAFLQAWNLLQFHGQVTVVSPESIAREGDDATVSEAPDAAYAAIVEAPTGGLVPEAQDLVASFPEVVDLVARLVAEGLALPGEDPFQGRAGAIILDTALAWPSARVGLMYDVTDADRATALRADAQVFDLSTADQHIEAIIEAVRAAQGTGQ